MDAPAPEEFTLADGRRIRVRPITPDDKQAIQAALAAQSAQTRYRRFLTDKKRLTGPELRYLTEIDGEHHFALVLVRIDEEGQEHEGAGVARYVELPDEPGTAEPAMAIADAFQGIGLGTMMFERLIECAIERGIERFHCELLADNRRMLQILDRLVSDTERHLEGAILVMVFELAKAQLSGASSGASLARPAGRASSTTSTES